MAPDGATYTNQRNVSAGHYTDARTATGPDGGMRTYTLTRLAVDVFTLG